MRLLHHDSEGESAALAWSFRTAPGEAGGLQLVLCGSLLVSHTPAPPVRVETGRRAAHRVAPRKAAGDLLVLGHAWPARTAETPRALRIGVAIGEWRKELGVFGDRVWQVAPDGTVASEPAPFESMPVTYARAFGGPGHSGNPIGRGLGGESLPNIEYPDDPVRSPASRPRPAGFGPLDPFWRPRSDYLGSYDAAWLAERWPAMPADFDPRHWNEAPEDQQFAGFFRGDERLSVLNMHKDWPFLEIVLPGRRARAFVQMQDGSFDELPLTLDTIAVDMDADCTELVWRGAMPVRSPRLRDLAFLFTMTEALDAPEPQAACREMFEALRRQRYPTASELEAAAVRPPPDSADDIAAAEARAAAVAAEALAAAERVFPGNSPPRSAPGSAPEPAPDPEKWTRERVIAARAAGEDMAEADLSGLDLSRLDLSGARLAGARLIRAALTDTSLHGADLRGADASGVAATNADFTAAMLAGTRFTGALLGGARFLGAELDGTDFSGVALAHAGFDGASGAHARFSGATLTAASFRQAKLPDADFTRAALTGAVFDEATLTRADFAGASGDATSFIGAEMVNLRANGAEFPTARFTGAVAPQSVWVMANLRGADFSRATLTCANFAETMLDQAVFDRALLESASFDEASLRHALLTRAKLVRASLERADLRDADLSDANLWQAGLFAARYARARLDGCFLTGTLLAG